MAGGEMSGFGAGTKLGRREQGGVRTGILFGQGPLSQMFLLALSMPGNEKENIWLKK